MMRLLQEGAVIPGGYTVERYIGEGAFSEVYRVKHHVFGRQAMKVFKTPGSYEETIEALGEAIMLSQMGHRNIVRVFNADILETAQGKRGFFTMEYVAGGSLQQYWQSFGDDLVPVEAAVDILHQVCDGLTLAHQEDPPVVHRDIKPQNILVGYDARGLRACISDFGLAKRVNPLMLAASARGTKCFKAPETFVDPMSDSCAGDVWALGLTLYLLLTDRFPYSGGDLDALNYKSFERPMTPASKLNIQVDKELDRILSRTLAVNRNERYQNAKELLNDLNKWQPKQQRQPEVKTKDALASQLSKSMFGMPSPADESKARALAMKALGLAKQPRNLPEAADLMEEAFNKWPALREEYEGRLKLWRCGIVM